MNKSLSIGVVVVTHQAKHHLKHCLPPLLNSSLKPRVLVVNSSSNDGTVETAQQMGAETLVIPRKEFNHGVTREKARRHLNADIAVMITPDAYLNDSCTLDKLIEPIVSGKASVAYARQIPHDGADFFESFSRDYNYPEQGHIRSIEDLSIYGVYSFFCSNACAAYSNAALEEIGGFQPVLLGEDTVAVAKLLRKGHRIAYVAEALVKHSHRYSISQEFRRSFDTGLARKEYRHLLQGAGKDTKRGAAYFKEMSKRLIKERPHWLPYAFFQTAAKWVGYQLGRASVDAPLWLKKRLSSQDFYWNSDAFLSAENKSP